jgi:transcriptional regulator with XRE-family HTH domain
MSPVPDARIQRRRLQRDLRRIREATGQSQREAAEAMYWSLSKLIRIETGSVPISISDLKALLLHYHVNEPAEVERLVEMARASKDRRAWWNSYRDATSPQYLTFVAFESAASRIYQFEPLLVPGLLQQEDYARALMQAIAGAASEERVQEWVDLRMRRQEEVFERTDPPEIIFILDEAVLHRYVGGRDVMRRQLLHLKQIAATEKNVTIEIVPFKKGAHPGLKGPIVIMQFPDDEDEDVLYVENYRGDMISREEEKEIIPAHKSLERLRELASEDSADAIIDNALEQMQ